MVRLRNRGWHVLRLALTFRIRGRNHRAVPLQRALTREVNPREEACRNTPWRPAREGGCTVF